MERHLPVSSITSRTAIRDEIDRQRLHELARSMSLMGLLQRIAVRPVQWGWEVIYGERRLLAARVLGWKEIGVRIIEADDITSLIIAAVENQHCDEPGLNACLDVVQRLLESGMSTETIAQALSCPHDRIRDLQELARSPAGRALVNAGLLGTACAWRAMMALSPALRRQVLESGELVTVEYCRRLAAHEAGKKGRTRRRARHPEPGNDGT